MKDSLLHGEKVSLRPATPEEIPQFFAWATNPDPEVQRYFYGDKTPTYEEFLDDWKPYYFCLLYTSPSPRDLSTSRMPSSA